MTTTWHGGPAKARIVKVEDETLRDLEWQLWIPPVDMDCYAGDTVESDLIGMWGDTYWQSFGVAFAALEMHHREHGFGLCGLCGPRGARQRISTDMICSECGGCIHNCSGARFSCRWDAEARAKVYRSQSARDAQRSGYGSRSYWDYLDESAQQHYDHFVAHGDPATAELMFTQTLSEALMGNDGD